MRRSLPSRTTTTTAARTDNRRGLRHHSDDGRTRTGRVPRLRARPTHRASAATRPRYPRSPARPAIDPAGCSRGRAGLPPVAPRWLAPRAPGVCARAWSRAPRFGRLATGIVEPIAAPRRRSGYRPTHDQRGRDRRFRRAQRPAEPGASGVVHRPFARPRSLHRTRCRSSARPATAPRRWGACAPRLARMPWSARTTLARATRRRPPRYQ